MNCFSRHETLWCEADVRFYTRHDASDCMHRKYRPEANTGDLIPRYSGAPYADVMECPTARIFSPDWKESAEYPNSNGWGRMPHGCIYTVWARHGHNWHNVTRIDLTFTPEDSPFYYYGRIYTSGLGNHTCKLRRMKSSHQVTHMLPWRCEFTVLDHGITLARWKARHDVRRTGWDARTTHHECHLVRTANGWQKADSFDDALKLQVLERMGIRAA